jgi:UDP-glucose 4-epimerase
MPDLPTVLVTGGAGYIGSHVVLALRERGRRVVVADDLSAGRRHAVPGDVPLVETHVGDAGSMEEVLRRHGVGTVMHFAGSISVPESIEKPDLYWRNNTAATLELASACVRAGVGALVFSSTAAVYGEGTHALLTEDSPTVPLNPYGRSKLTAEWLLADIQAATGLKCLRLRYFNAAGADPQGRTGQHGGSQHLIRVACLAALGRRPCLEIFGDDYPTRDGTCERDFIHVADLADVHLAALNYLEADGEGTVMNVGYGRGYSVREVVAAVERVTGRPLPVRTGPRRAGDPASVVADNGRAHRLLGWTPRHDDLDAIIASTLAWEAKHG